ncbi:hypothetical protein AYO49_03280 [Verrucomicrobiaceae bacterium SCGC AG-212-N21]|nr:hypothetical protein AYO49_03280 [Verrucomicrobiaceae bacterium SCGC AG-212-N21]
MPPPDVFSLRSTNFQFSFSIFQFSIRIPTRLSPGTSPPPRMLTSPHLAPLFRAAAALLIGVLPLLASCTGLKKSKSASPGSDSMVPITDSPTEGSILKLAQIERVTAEVSTSQPPQLLVHIQGIFPDGATGIQDVQQQRFADGYMITIVTARPRNAVASLALIPFERKLTLSLEGMAKGPCKIVVNSVATTVTVP